MKKLILAAVFFAISAQASENANLVCVPSQGNDYFTNEVSLNVLDENSIEVNGYVLEKDVGYKPNKPTTYKRYEGETESAADWSDSGSVEIFYDGGERLKFAIRGEIFISETFVCTELN